VICILFVCGLADRPWANWMGVANISTLTLQQITIPGTHDSGTFDLTDEILGIPELYTEMVYIADKLGIPVSEIIIGWSHTQTENFYNQYLDGIRYLDIRCIYDYTDNTWKLHHSFVIGDNLEVLFQQTRQFLIDYPSEVLVLELSHNENQSQASNQMLFDMVQNYIGKYLLSPSMGFKTIGEMISSGKNVILTCTLDNLPSNFWSENTIINSYANSPDLTTMEQYNVHQIQSWQAHGIYPNQLYKMSWTLTPNADTILESIIPGTPKTVIELADIANRDLDNFWNTVVVQDGFKYPVFSNILIIDDYTTSPIVEITQRGLNK